MPEQELPPPIAHLLQKGRLEEIEGDVQGAARLWLGQARDDLPAVELLLSGHAVRLAYNAAYDIMRKAAEAVVTFAGYRVTATPGHHEAVFVAANAIEAAGSGAFSAPRARIARETRSRTEYYVDVERLDEFTEADARQIYAWASEAVEVAASIIG